MDDSPFSPLGFLRLPERPISEGFRNAVLDEIWTPQERQLGVMPTYTRRRRRL
jgi:hypothetical protein